METKHLKTQKLLGALWPFLAFLFLISVFYWKFFLKGLIPVPADITVGMYFPWLDYKWGYEVGVPVKNSLLSDVVSQIYPLRTYAMSLIKSGSWPLWNPLMFGGYPLLANIQIGIFNPANIYFFIFSDSFAWGMQTVTQSFLIAFFTYLFLRGLNLGKLPSILGGIIFSFSGFNTIWLEWNVHGYTTAFFALLMYSTHLFFSKQKPLFGILISLSLCFLIFSGYPQTVFYSLTAVGLYALFAFKFEIKKYLSFALFVCLGFSLSAIQLLPTVELFFNSQRQAEILIKEQSFLPWSFLISLFAPDFFGNQTTGNFWGKNDYTNNVLYSGIVPLILAVFSLKLLKNKNVRFFLLLFIFSLIISLPLPIVSSVFSLGFLGQSAMAATRILFLVNFSVAVLAAISFDCLWKNSEKVKNIFRIYYLPVIVLGGVFLGTFLAYRKFAVTLSVADGEFSAETLEIWARNLKVGMRNLIFPSFLAAGTFFLFLIGAVGGRYLRKISLCLVFLFAAGELFRFGWKYTPFTRPALLFPSTPVLDFLKKQKGIFRVDGGDAVPMNMLMPYGLESLSAYDPIYPLSMAQFLSLVDNGEINNPKSRFGKIDTFGSALFDLANVCYVLSVKRDQQGKPDIKGTVGSQFRLAKFESVFEDKTVVVLRNKSCFPRAWLIRNYLVERDSEMLARKMTDKSIDLQKIIFLEKNLEIELPAGDIGRGETADWILREANRQEIEVSVSKPAILFIADSFYPGWKAYVDGKETEIYRADFVFKAIYIPGGRYTIDFVYEPKVFLVGKKISLVSLFLVGLTIIGLKLPLLKNHKKLYTAPYAGKKSKENRQRS